MFRNSIEREAALPRTIKLPLLHDGLCLLSSTLFTVMMSTIVIGLRVDVFQSVIRYVYWCEIAVSGCNSVIVNLLYHEERTAVRTC